MNSGPVNSGPVGEGLGGILARLKEHEAEAKHTFEVVSSYVLQDDSEYEEASTLLKEIKGKIKLLEEERKISVQPMNEQVRQINGWFKGPVSKLEAIEKKLKDMIAAYALAKQEEQRRLLAEAAAAARAAQEAQSVTDTAPPGQEEALALMAEAQATAAPRIAGIGVKETWEWELVDEALVPDAFKSVDKRKVDAAVKAGKHDIPGLRIFKSARVTARG